MITPAFLKPGDKIGMVATARKVSPSEIEPAVRWFESRGFVVITGRNLYASDRQFAGTDALRRADLQEMLDNPDIRAVVCARGGYGTVRIIDKLDFSGFLRHPKWIVGYSDITVLHSHIQLHYGIETLHATMPLNFPAEGPADEPAEALLRCLCGESPAYWVEPGALSMPGHARGIVVGGNLSILYSLSGTPSDIDTRDKILFIEDLDEYLYHIDRMMMNLKRSGKLDRVAGLIVGGMTEMRDNTIAFGKSAEEIILETVAEYKYPVLFGFPAGHIKDNMPLILGREAVVDVSAGIGSLVFQPPDQRSASGKLKSLFKPAVFILGFFALLYLLYALLLGNL